MCLIFMGQGYPQQLFNLEHFLIYSIWSSFLYSSLFYDRSIAGKLIYFKEFYMGRSKSKSVLFFP